ncbi:peptidase S8 and S53, subtilisin, kexin, sedolisin [Mycobacteroides abscessus subsp. abscessus]|uniref:type VII secretion-associated serine protease mycosin n=1 Tax=Mycobacteroides abscessus TaxID=36809 RepID=UPI000929301F|nr:type VII secretion-associated serine protease mycosin [Mycobacteroides abscessus]SIJ22076.1 peptidase S8 and S53, subtilisin, kexin, sedolisin [Mycobacteroides abscessus subsp. abscessus]SLH38584.1 peptidase S8 and S53, subtilisin, kexin, sedolisin [Mycobacteroides abscessus subsp. abscessus]
MIKFLRTPLVAIAAVSGLLLLSCPPASAMPKPVVDEAALPAPGKPGPSMEMRDNGGCVIYGAREGFDPAAVPPSQAMMNLPEAWKTSRGAGVSVAVIDSGVAPQPRLPNLDAGGDWVDPAGNGLTDCDGHGTAVAGIIGAAPGPDGFSGVAPESRIVSFRQMSAQWSPKMPPGGDQQAAKSAGDVQTLARTIRTAADFPGIRVMNISVIDCIPANKQVDQAALGAALYYAAKVKDIVVVAAAGNTGENNCNSNPLMDPKHLEDPRNWGGATIISTPSYWQPFVLSVASLTPTGQPSGFTMAGPWVGIAAPGEQIVSLGNGKDSGLVNGQPDQKEPLAVINGSSYSAAYVSGVAALIRSTPKFHDLTAYQVINRLMASAHNSARSPSNLVGAGVIDPVAALTWEIPDGPTQPANMPVKYAAPPVPPQRDDPWPRRIAFIGGGVALCGAVIIVTLIGLRRDRTS